MQITITLTDLDAARDKVRYGKERRSMALNGSAPIT
jgi:ATP-dependent Zn protease